MSHITLKVNGTAHTVNVEPLTPLLYLHGLIGDWCSGGRARPIGTRAINHTDIRR